jgi:hypothetical protein
MQCVHAHPEPHLKFVVHHGTILRQRVAGQEELLGPVSLSPDPPVCLV